MFPAIPICMSVVSSKENIKSALIYDSKLTSNSFISAKLRNSAKNNKSNFLEKETDVDVEGSVTILLVEAAGVLECHDEVLIHDEAKTCTG